MIKPLEPVLGHTFRQKELLLRALTHSSLAHEAGDSEENADNEELEFLGDAVLGLVAAEWLFRTYPELKEGELTRLRAALVSRKHLGQVGTRLELGQHLRLGRGEERSGGRKKSALLANAMEALIAALYLDGGMEAARRFIEAEVVVPYAGELREGLAEGAAIGDHKSALQEFLQARKKGQPEYAVKAESGPDHRKRFLVEVRVMPESGRGKALARGDGPTKKHAEQEAARKALEKLIAESKEKAAGA